MPIASEKPLQENGAEQQYQYERDGICWPAGLGANGFSSDMGGGVGGGKGNRDHEVGRTKPSSTRTKSLPCHQESRRSSIAIEPSPWGLSAATRR